MLLCFWLLSPVAHAWQIEVGDVRLNWSSYNSVTFQQPFPLGVTPVVVSLSYGTRGASNDEPATVRIRNVSRTGFEIAIVEPRGSSGRFESNNATLSYLAVEPGVHELPNGDVIEAGSFATTALQHGSGVSGAESWENRTIQGNFSFPPVLVGMLQTTNNEANNNAPGNGQVSRPFMTLTVRNLNSSSFDAAIERSEVRDQPFPFVLVPETVGYVLMENGAAGTLKNSNNLDIKYESFRTGDSVRGWQNGCYYYPSADFFHFYLDFPKTFATKIRHDGGDGGWVRRCALSTSQIGLAIDEDRDRDNERSHTGEDVGVLIFERAFAADVQNQAPQPKLKKTVFIDSDPINNGNLPKAIPGAQLLYTIRIENIGNGEASNVQLDDAVPDHLDLYVANTEDCGPVVVRDGNPSSGLICNAIGLSYDDGSGNYNYSPTPDAQGFDSNVTDIRINFFNNLEADTGNGTPSVELDLRMRLR